MRLIRALRDCKQRSLTVSKKAPTVSKKLPPVHFAQFWIRKLEKAVAVCGMRSGVPEENSGKVAGKIAGKFFLNRGMRHFLGFQAPGKANLPGTLGRQCPGRCPHLPCGVFCEINSYSLLEFFWARPIFPVSFSRGKIACRGGSMLRLVDGAGTTPIPIKWGNSDQN